MRQEWQVVEGAGRGVGMGWDGTVGGVGLWVGGSGCYVLGYGRWYAVEGGGGNLDGDSLFTRHACRRSGYRWVWGCQHAWLELGHGTRD